MLRGVQPEMQMPEALQKPLELRDTAAGSLPVPDLQLPVNTRACAGIGRRASLRCWWGVILVRVQVPSGVPELLRKLMDMPLYP
jgi:hypothetical protein